MTIQFLIFTIRISRRRVRKCAPLPGYRPTAEDRWLDRKSSMNQLM
ncbi:hypothetical protein [Halobacillus salinus]|nr:hypothetical protein [Halobacillus salinus]